MEQEKGNEEQGSGNRDAAIRAVCDALGRGVITVRDGSVIIVEASSIPGRTILKFWGSGDELLEAIDPDLGMILGTRDVEELIAILRWVLEYKETR